METRNLSATTWAKTVSCPWPWELEPVSTVISPVRSTRTVALSNPAPPLGFTNVETPTPTSSPRARGRIAVLDHRVVVGETQRFRQRLLVVTRIVFNVQARAVRELARP